MGISPPSSRESNMQWFYPDQQYLEAHVVSLRDGRRPFGARSLALYSLGAIMETEIETWRSINLTFRCYCDFLKSGGQRRLKPVWGSVSCSLFPEGINGDRNRDMAQHKLDLLGLLRVARERRPVGLHYASDPFCL